LLDSERSEEENSQYLIIIVMVLRTLIDCSMRFCFYTVYYFRYFEQNERAKSVKKSYLQFKNQLLLVPT